MPNDGTSLIAIRYIVMLALLMTSFAPATLGDQYSYVPVFEKEVFQEADMQMKMGNCDVAWSLVWAIFIEGNGNPHASGWLASRIVANGLIPPGSSDDGISQGRHAFILSTYSAPSGNPDDLEILKLMHAIFPIHNARFVECLDDASTTSQVCLVEAIENGVVPSLETYSSELEALAMMSPRATCSPLAVVVPPQYLP